jgi:Bacterial regulatory protein, Fis family
MADDIWQYRLARMLANDDKVKRRASAWNYDERQFAIEDAFLFHQEAAGIAQDSETEAERDRRLRGWVRAHAKDICSRAYPQRDAMFERRQFGLSEDSLEALKEAYAELNREGFERAQPPRRNGKVAQGVVWDVPDDGLSAFEAVDERLTNEAIAKTMAKEYPDELGILIANEASGNQAEAAESLGMSGRTFRRRLAEARRVVRRLTLDWEYDG